MAANATKLTEEQIADLRRELKAGAATADMAKKYGISEAGVLYHRRIAMGKKHKRNRATGGAYRAEINLPVDIHAFNQDIIDGMQEKELCEKYKLGRNTMYKFKRDIREGKTARVSKRSASMTVETAKRIAQMVMRLAEKHPEIVEELEILPRLARKHVNVLAEII